MLVNGPICPLDGFAIIRLVPQPNLNLFVKTQFVFRYVLEISMCFIFPADHFQVVHRIIDDLHLRVQVNLHAVALLSVCSISCSDVIFCAAGEGRRSDPADLHLALLLGAAELEVIAIAFLHQILHRLVV